MSAALVPPLLRDGWVDGWPSATPIGILLEQVREGNTLVTAALTAGLDPSQVAHWAVTGSGLLARARGRQVEKRRRPFADFATALARAEADAETAMVAVVRDVALADVKDSWRAAAWLLDHQAKAAPPIPESDDEDELERLATAVPATSGDDTYE